MRPRLLPVTASVMALLLATKIADVALALAPTALLATAQAAPAAPPKPEAATPEPPPPPPEPVKQSDPPKPSSPPPPAVSEAERQLLQDLRARRDELDARERALADKAAVLDAAQQKLSGRVTELAALQTRLEQLEKDRTARQEANWAGLVKTYEAMKPRDAAAIFNDMDMPVLLQVLDRMKETKAAAVLAAMLPDRARLATAQLAAMRTRSEAVPAPANPS